MTIITILSDAGMVFWDLCLTEHAHGEGGECWDVVVGMLLDMEVNHVLMASLNVLNDN